MKGTLLLSKRSKWARASLMSLLASLVVSASAQVAVTTYHNDNYRTGLNSNETILTTSNVNSSQFGLLFSLPVDGQVYAQPLYLPSVTIPGKGVHNVVYVATEHNSLYAFDADSNTGANAQPLWHRNFGPSVPNADTGTDDINPEIGITSTPVIYTKNGVPTIFLVSKTKTIVNGNPVYTQTLYAVSALTGLNTAGSPIVIGGRSVGTGDGSSGGFVQFNPLIQHNRPGLLLVQNPTGPGSDSQLYIAYASHGDNGPYHGWMFVYDADKMLPLKFINTTPNAVSNSSGLAAGGIWQSGGGPASDGSSVYFGTGNGWFDPTTSAYGDSILRLDQKTFRFLDYFSPFDQASLDDYDTDLGSGGVLLIPPTASGAGGKNLLVQVGKEGSIFLLDTTNLGHNNSTTNNVHQELPYAIGGVWGTSAYFNNSVYFGPSYSSLVSFNLAGGMFTTTSPVASSPTYYQFPGPSPSISANGTTNGIVWAIQSDGYNTNGPAILHAYDATNVATELYNSSATSGRDTIGTGVKFTTPTIANGKVYAGSSGQVGVFGLGTWASPPTVSPASGNYSSPLKVTVTDSTPNATIYYTTDGTVPTIASKIYTGPVTLTTSATFQAKAYIQGQGASAATINNYLVNAVVGTGTGLTGKYYNNSQYPSGTPTVTELDPSINFSWNGASPVAGVAGTNWSGLWVGQIQPETTGPITISTISDDGVRVYLNDNVIIDDFVPHAPTTDTATLYLAAGHKYNFTIKYFQAGGGSTLQLFWNGPGLPLQIVPTTQLYPSQ